MKRKYNEGFSLIEVLAAIAVLAILFVPTCTSLLMSMRLNEGTEAMMQAEFDVSSTVEILMAEGIPDDILGEQETAEVYLDRFPGVMVTVSKVKDAHYYNVAIASAEVDSVSVTTRIRSVEAVKGEEDAA